MLISRLHRFLIPSEPKRDRRVAFWFTLTIGFALFYGVLALQKAFRAEYVVQDDAREYVFWMQRFIDPSLLPNDLIAEYFKSITPPGYAAIYQLLATFGIEPLWFSKVLPVGLGLIATIYSFAICLRLFPIPFTAFASSLILNQSLWFRDDLSSATPRAFVTPLFLAFLYYLIRNQRLGILVTLILQALIYPPLVFITIALLSLKLWHWNSGKLHLRSNQLIFIGTCIVLSAIALIPYALSSAEFAPVITRSQALNMPELHPGGRHPFFHPNPWHFWLIGEHSGIIPPLMPPLIWFGVLLPLLMQSRFPLIQQISDRISVLPQIVYVSLGLFAAAHLLLLRLFFPTRYTTHSFRIVFAISAGIVLTILLDIILRSAQRTITKLSIIFVASILLLLYPQFSSSFPNTNFRVSNNAALYQFLQSQPKDTLVATLSDEANNIATFAQRSVLFSKEHSLPFHLGYYNQIRQRIIDVMQAQYSSDLTLAKRAIDQYQINFWLLENTTFTPEFLQKTEWLKSFQPAHNTALNNLQQAKTPAISKLSRCSVFNSDRFTLLDAACIKSVSSP